MIHATLGEHDKAVSDSGTWHVVENANEEQVECYQRAVRLDQYLAVAYFQQGVSNFLVGDFEEALANFNDTLLYLRGNTYIDYEQLGLKFRLFSCEVLFNRGLCYVYLQQKDGGMMDFAYAVKEKVTPDHEVIDEAIREQGEVCRVYSISLYRCAKCSRAIPFSLSLSGSFTDQTARKSRTSKPKTTWAKLVWSPRRTDPTLSQGSRAQRSRKT